MPPSGQPATSFLVRLGWVGLMLLPVTLLVLGSLRAQGEARDVLMLGSLFQLLACGLALLGRQGWREPAGPAVIMLYVIALSWLLLGGAGQDDWAMHLGQAVLLVVPLGVFAVQCLRDSGAPALRRARHLADRLASRTDWPANLQDCRLLPEVKALREALHVDASPALNLLSNPRPQVRVAALGALEFRQNWRSGQAEVVLHLARRAEEPEVRAAAVNALANTDDRLIIEVLAEFLHDPVRLVRQTTTEALLWNTEARWPWVRHAVRMALADPACQEDGPLRPAGNLLAPDAVADLTAWAAEKGLLAYRAALTLGAHYHQVLAAGSDPELVRELRCQLTNAHTPPMLRVELARALQHHRELDVTILTQLLGSSLPTLVRLIAVEALLAEEASPEVLATLRDLARLPNREIALATADVVQRRLGVDLGLPVGEPLPPAHSRLASEVARRVLLWAQQPATGEQSDSSAIRSPLPVGRGSSGVATNGRRHPSDSHSQRRMKEEG